MVASFLCNLQNISVFNDAIDIPLLICENFIPPLSRLCRQLPSMGAFMKFIGNFIRRIRYLDVPYPLPPLHRKRSHFLKERLSTHNAFRIAPLEGSCRQRRLRGGISHRKNYIHNFITFHPHCQATNITLTLRFA